MELKCYIFISTDETQQQQLKKPVHSW